MPRYGTDRDPAYGQAQLMATQNMGLDGNLLRPGVELPKPVPPAPEPAPEDATDGGDA